MLPGYFYALTSTLTGIPRLGPTLLALVELAVTGVVFHRFLGLRGAWVAVALLAVSPWHLFYSRVVGTCVGVGLLVLLGIHWAKRPLLSFWNLTVGLLYYTAFRLFFVRELLVRLRSRDWKGVGGTAAALLLVLAIVAVSASSLGDFFDRGSYNLLRPELHWFTNTIGSLAIAFIPVLEPFRYTTDHFMADYVHGGFTTSLPLWTTPLGWGTSGLLAWALFRSSHAKAGLRREVWFVAFVLVALAPLGPSFSRYLFLTPLLCGVAAFGWTQLPEKFQRYPVLLGVTLTALIPSVLMFRNLSNQAALEPFFHSRHTTLHRFIQNEVPSPGPASVVVVANYGYQSARYWQNQTGNYALLPLLPPDKLIPHLAYTARGLPQHLLVEKVPSEADRLSGFEKAEPMERTLRAIRSMAIVEKDEPIPHGNTIAGRHLVVRWIYETGE